MTNVLLFLIMVSKLNQLSQNTSIVPNFEN